MDKFLYTINYSGDEKSLCALEMKYIFNNEEDNKCIVSDKCISPSISPFIKERLSFTYESDSLEELIDIIKNDKLEYEDFKVSFVKNSTDLTKYDKRLQIIKEIGMNINGEANLYAPKIEFGVTCFNSKWIFGFLEKHDNSWHEHDLKPCTYSNSLNFKVARSLVNIAVGDEVEATLVDPCCGIGTVLLEALSLGYNIKGYEINPFIGERAKSNLGFFNYNNVVTIMDMHNANERFYASIIDIPYGLFNPVTKAQQSEIIKTARRISEKMVIISYENMDDMIRDSGFNVVDKCTVSKGKFKRYVSVCI